MTDFANRSVERGYSQQSVINQMRSEVDLSIKNIETIGKITKYTFSSENNNCIVIFIFNEFQKTIAYEYITHEKYCKHKIRYNSLF
jgi:hypothetical protein